MLLDQSLNQLLSALHALREASYTPPHWLPQYWKDMSLPAGAFGLVTRESYDLSIVSMPPEMYEADEENRHGGEGRTGNIAFFADDVSGDI